MFQFTTETIINSNLDSNGKTPKFAAIGTTGVRITRVGDFYSADCSSVTKTPYAASQIESISCAIPTTLISKDCVLRLAVKMKRVDSYRSDYANDMTYNAKQLWYEINAKASDTPADIIAKFKKALKNEVAQSDNAYIEISTPQSSTSTMIISCTDVYTRFTEVQIQEVFTPLNSTTGYTTLTGEDSFKVLLDIYSAGTKTAGSEGFGSFWQLVKNHRLPTIDNTNWTAINQEERPIPGGQYTEYEFTSSIVRDNMGLSAVGEQVKSVTNHVFYVLSTYTAAFEAALTAGGFAFANQAAATTTTTTTTPEE